MAQRLWRKSCNADISRGGASAKHFSSSGFVYHLKSKHPKRHADYEKHTAQKRKVSLSTPTTTVADVFEKARKFSSDGAKAKGITQKIMEFIALNDQLFSVVQDVGFRRLIKHIEPHYAMPSRRHFSDMCLSKLYDVIATHVHELIARYSSLQLHNRHMELRRQPHQYAESYHTMDQHRFQATKDSAPFTRI